MKYMEAETLFLLSGIVLTVLGSIYPNDVIDINLHDTYFVIKLPFLSYMPAILLLFLSFVYYLFSKYFIVLNTSLGVLHYMLTLLGVIGIWQSVANFSSPGNYNALSQPILNFGLLLLIAVVLFLLGQMVFIANIIWALLKSKVSKP